MYKKLILRGMQYLRILKEKAKMNMTCSKIPQSKVWKPEGSTLPGLILWELVWFCLREARERGRGKENGNGSWSTTPAAGHGFRREKVKSET